MTVDALRLELLKEIIRQELILSELAKQRELGPEVRRELRLENAGPMCAHTGLRLTTLPNHDKSPVRQDGQLKYIPLLSELCLDEALMTRGRALMLNRRSAKERIEEWYQPPWHRSGDEDNASLIRVRWSKKTLSGIKRKRNSECSASNKERSYEQWTCALCDVNTSNVVDLDWSKGTAGLKKIAAAETYRSAMQHNSWNCSICQIKCSGELDLKNHLKGRRHQENVEALQGESKEIDGNSGFHEAGSYEKKMPQLGDNNRRPASTWNCSICKAYSTSESDLRSHLRGRRHQKNVRAQFIEENNSTTQLWPDFVERNNNRQQYSVHKTVK
ncbi:hypothetical protein PR202_gb03062 [Eleusine coracana subsp. coracana]|uniref:Matrin-type domain-containing protein n=1 Tax=Eleusine coracana subsp. coracana TaxID=191504 RepID=A0AAV5E0W2_ELECO|nr:hypothetical protein PR202_gb03062 [Eleusine coracana subsp. coracana]